jgi:hypothetical protein
MMRKLGGDLAGIFAIARLFTHSDEPMELNAPPKREQAVQHLLIERVVETEAGRDCTVGPDNRPLFVQKLFVPRESKTVCLHLVRWTFERRRYRDCRRNWSVSTCESDIADMRSSYNSPVRS